MKIKILGAGREVGRASVLLQASEGEKGILLDHGVDVSSEVPRFPEHVAPRDLVAATLTHAHLDHSGGLPLIYVSVEIPLIVTPLTLELAELLIRDFLKISRYYIPYEVMELMTMIRNSRAVSYGDAVEVGKYHIEVFSAGHIPGSSMFMVEVEGLKVLYTGDFNLASSCLLQGADTKPFKEADIVIIEATYAKYDHPDRLQNEAVFVRRVRDVVESGGTVLVPAFAVGRAQEIACVIHKYGVDAPVYIDGMARQAAAILEKYADEYLRDARLYRDALSSVTKVEGAKMRRRIVKRPCVIISSAGMLKGGAAVFYMERIMEDPRNAVFFVSYQVPDTPGRKVLEEGVFVSPRKTGKVEARVEWFDFSAHSGRRELIKALEYTRSSALIVIFHSEEKVGAAFRDYVESRLGREVVFPRVNEEITV